MQDMSRMLCHEYHRGMDRVEELRYLVLAAQRQGSRRLARALRPLGVTPAQAEVLTVLREAGRPLSVRELGDHLVCEPGSPSRLARSIEAVGLIASGADEADGRVTALRLTDRGREVAAGVAIVERAFHTALAASLPDDGTVEAIVVTLRALVADDPAGRALARRRGAAPATPA